MYLVLFIYHFCMSGRYACIFPGREDTFLYSFPWLHSYISDPFEHQNMRFWRSVSSGSFPRICSEIVLKSRAVRSIHFFVFKSSERKKDHASSSDWLGSVRVPSLSKRKTFLWISNASRMNSWKERSIDSIFLLIVKKREFESNKILFSVYFFLTFCLFSHFPYTHFMNNILLKNHEIGHYSGYKTSVFSDYFFELTTESDLPKLANIYRFSLENNIPFLIIWWWTNILFSSEKFRGIIVKNSLSCWEYNQDKKFLHAFSNEPIWAIAQTLENDFSQDIWHRFIWLPGSIGGAIYGNAGCFGLEIESNFLRATVFDMFLEKRRNISREEMKFTYRYSFLKENPQLFLLWACFDLSEKREKYHSDVDNIDFRENKQPKGNSCGSFFKNPSRDISAGFLIEQVWLKWYRHGGAYWSDLHANFLMSEWETCKPSDLLELVRLTQKKVKEETGYDLMNEVRIIL